MINESAVQEPRPYHHGDLRRALIEAARSLLETEGPSALSLRAVARQAGVSPAAPYHHFRDKSELMRAVGHEGWVMLEETLIRARGLAKDRRDAIVEVGVAYVCFAREHPALYRVMYDNARNAVALPEEQMHEGTGGAYGKVRDALVDAGLDRSARVELEAATVTAWCTAHGLAEMSSFKQLGPTRDAVGGDLAFIREVFSQAVAFARKP